MRKVMNHTDTKGRGLLLIAVVLLIFNSSLIVTAQQADDDDYKIRTVVIDPGHGGKDPGARGDHGLEKDIVLGIGLKLGAYIEEHIPDVKVIYTRTTDEFIPLYRRAEIANENDADLFISLHANGWSNPASYGTETLVLGLHRSDENFEVAKRENSVILMEEDYTTRYENFDPNSQESYIIFSLMQNVYDHQSISFAGKVQEQFRERARRKDRGVKRQGLLVLAQTSMPGVLIETGFVTNPNEEKYLTSEEGQDYIASAIFRAFRDYKTDIESRSGRVAILSSQTLSTLDSETEYETQDTSGIYYKVQISASSESVPIDSEVFGELDNIEEFRQGDIYKYAAGRASQYDQIVNYSREVRKQFPDAFIIAVENGAIIPLQEAMKRSGVPPQEQD